MCNKIQFSTRKEARDYIKISGSKNKEIRNGKDIRKSKVYKCPKCHYYHTTSYTPSQTRAERRKSRKLALIRSKVNEFSSLTGITERWRWLAENEYDFIKVITGDVSVVRFDEYKQNFKID